MSPETWEMDGGILYSTQELAEAFQKSGCQEITISGGEPFLQPEALAEFIRLAGDTGVIIYSGFTYEELLELPDAEPLLNVCDLLIDGQFVEELCDGKNMRGSSNQRAIMLTDRYQEVAAHFGTQSTKIEYFFHNDMTRMIGIPRPEWLARERDRSTNENSSGGKL